MKTFNYFVSNYRHTADLENVSVWDTKTNQRFGDFLKKLIVQYIQHRSDNYVTPI